ncbi:hypothetical protein IE077_004206 [Cardiosporidium cionae]|uniref:Uncharacterized protein n=1 Tax=Cardiosporidium cionae TaxID=476202 RepID=A0ABQ7J607_9APIC|nr:hypothetical protein IE077_004206 [Cardiosporidium cionae]|eukprot:KAF8819431.1 hypothetical protein IE077_004206 [Cardiosporidium cionae]
MDCLCVISYTIGLRVTEDLLTAHVSVKDWIHDLLVSRRVRCIRPNNTHLRGKSKCVFASSDRTCGLYSRKKCKACFENLKGLLLYPLGEEEFESARLRIDPDVKALWDSLVTAALIQIELPAVETILKDYNIDMPVPKWQQEIPREKRGKAAGMGRLPCIEPEILVGASKYTQSFMKSGLKRFFSENETFRNGLIAHGKKNFQQCVVETNTRLVIVDSQVSCAATSSVFYFRNEQGLRNR